MLGNGGADVITLGAGISNAIIDLGAGADELTLSVENHNLTVSNIETLTGGVGDDVVTFNSLTAGSGVYDLGVGADQVILGNGTGANTITVSNAESFTGSSAADTVTFGAAVASGHGQPRCRHRQPDPGCWRQHPDRVRNRKHHR